LHPLSVGTVVFACTLGGALLGNWLRNVVPEHHLQDASRETVNVGIGLVATMSALVLGLVTASAKSSFDAVDAAVRHSAADILVLDRLLARYGPETGEIRGALKEALALRTKAIWPEGSSPSAPPDPSSSLARVESIASAIRGLEPRDSSQRWLQGRALERAEEVLQVRWLVFAGVGSSVPPLFLAVLLFWLTITFASFGLFAPRNATVFVILFVSALSVAGAVFLVLELDGPFDGLLRVSPAPMYYALAHLNV
jgi:hypothetical protein